MQAKSAAPNADSSLVETLETPKALHWTLETYLNDLRAFRVAGWEKNVEYEPGRWASPLTAEFGIYEKFPIWMETTPQILLPALEPLGFSLSSTDVYREHRGGSLFLLPFDGGRSIVELCTLKNPIDPQCIPKRVDGGKIGSYTLSADFNGPWKDKYDHKEALLAMADAILAMGSYLLKAGHPTCMPHSSGWKRIKDYSRVVWNP